MLNLKQLNIANKSSILKYFKKYLTNSKQFDKLKAYQTKQKN